MKPFDLEAAKRGEPIGFLFNDRAELRRFVGVCADGRIAYETISDCPSLQRTSPENLRMMPRKVVKYGVMDVNRRGLSINTSLYNTPFGEPLSDGYVTVRVEWEE